MPAAGNGQIDSLTELLKAGAEVNIAGYDEGPPLIYAIGEGCDV